MSDTALTARGAGLTVDPFSVTRFTIKRPFFSLFGRQFRVFGPDGQLLLFVRHKMFTLRDEWNIFRDESEQAPLIRVKARQALAINIVTDVFDAVTGSTVGTVRNKGLKSIVRDTWEILGDSEDQVRGQFVEDSNALLRRFIPLLLGHWHMEVEGQAVAKLDQVFRFFTKEFTLEITNPGRVDPRFIIGCAMLALMKEIMREQK